MGKFVIRLLIFAVLFVIIDFSFGKLLEHGYYHVKSGTIYQSVYGLENCNDEVLILGASEVKHGLISSMIEDSMGLTCYNLGFDGNNIYYQYALLQEILKRHTPKIILISTTISAENENTVISLLPLSHKYKNIRKMVGELSPVEKFKSISQTYTYNSLFLNIIQGHIAIEPQTKGYKPMYAVDKTLKLDSIDYVVKTSARSLDYFSRFIKLTKASGCKVVVVNTPKFFINRNWRKPNNITQVVNQMHVNYLDYENDTVFTSHSEFFYDGVHLNHTGAMVFTSRLISDMRATLKLSMN